MERLTTSGSAGPKPTSAPRAAASPDGRPVSGAGTKDYRVVLLPPSYVTRLWQCLRPAIEASMPPLAVDEAEGAMANMLEGLLAGKTQCWLGIEKVPNTAVPIVHALAVTDVVAEFGTGTKSLWISALYAYRGLPPPLTLVGFERLKAYAREQGCRYMAATTNSQRVIEIAQELGGNATNTLVRLEV